MIRFGTARNHASGLSLPGPRGVISGTQPYSVAFNVLCHDWGFLNRIIELAKNTGSWGGWEVRLDNSSSLPELTSVHWNGAANSTLTTASPMVLSTIYSVVIVYHSDGDMTIDIDDGTYVLHSAHGQSPATHDLDLILGNSSAYNVGAPVDLGHVCGWKGERTAAEISQYHAGITMPAYSELDFWHKCLQIPGRDEISGESWVLTEASEGDVTFVADTATDSKFSGEVLGFEVQEAATRDLLHRRAPEGRIAIAGDRRLLTQALFRDSVIQASRAMDPGGEGWLGLDRERPARCISRVYHPGTKPRVELEYRELVRYLRKYYDSGIAARAVRADTGFEADGRGWLSAQASPFVVDRLSSAWIAGTGGRIVEISANRLKLTPDGLLLEPGGRENSVKDSSFKRATSSDWAAEGTAVLADEATDVLFDPETSKVLKAKKVTAAAAGNNGIKQATTFSCVASDHKALSVDLKNVSGATIRFRLKRSSDGDWYTGSGWQASQTDFAADVVEAANALGYQRFVTFLDYTDQSPTAQTHELHILATSASSEILVGHSQLEPCDDGLFASSRLVTTVSKVTGAADHPSQEHESSAVWHASRGAIAFSYLPALDEADLSGILSTWRRSAFWLHNDSDPSGDWWNVGYFNDNDGSGSYLGTEVRRAGSSSYAKFYVDLDKTRRYRVRFVWGLAGDFGREHNHCRMFVSYEGQPSSENRVGPLLMLPSGFPTAATGSFNYGPPSSESSESVLPGWYHDIEVYGGLRVSDELALLL